MFHVKQSNIFIQILLDFTSQITPCFTSNTPHHSLILCQIYPIEQQKH